MTTPLTTAPDITNILDAANRECVPIFPQHVKRIKIGIILPTCPVQQQPSFRLEGLHLHCNEPTFITFYEENICSRDCKVFRQCVVTSSFTDPGTGQVTCDVMCERRPESDIIYLQWYKILWSNKADTPCIYRMIFI